MNVRTTLGLFAAAAVIPAVASGAVTAYASRTDDSDKAFQALDWGNAVKVVVPLAAGAVWFGAKLLNHGKVPDVLKPALLGAAFGAFFGGTLFARVDTLLNRDEVASDTAAANASLDATRAMFARHGISQEEGLGPLFLNIDRNYLNAGYLHVPHTPIEAKFLGTQVGTHVHFAQLRDVVAHELAHRVIHKVVPGLEGAFQPGVVDESLADTFAAAVDTDNWLIAEGAGMDRARNMADPHTERPIRINGELVLPPATRSEYLDLPRTFDSGGRHVNVGIPNRAAYLIGSQLGRDAMAEIYARALRFIPNDCTIADLARATERAAGDAYGVDSESQTIVRNAWGTIGYRDAFASDPAKRID